MSTEAIVGVTLGIIGMIGGFIAWLTNWIDGRIETKIKDHKLLDVIEENKRLREYAEKSK